MKIQRPSFVVVATWRVAQILLHKRTNRQGATHASCKIFGFGRDGQGILAAAVPRAAHADEFGRAVGRIYAYGLATPALNLGLGIYDLTAERPSRAYGVAEVLLTAPQVVIGGFATLALLDDGDNEPGLTALVATVYFALPTALMIHGIVTASRPERAPPPNVGAIGSVKAVILPTMVSDGGNVAPGLGVAARF